MQSRGCRAVATPATTRTVLCLKAWRSLVTQQGGALQSAKWNQLNPSHPISESIPKWDVKDSAGWIRATPRHGALGTPNQCKEHQTEPVQRASDVNKEPVQRPCLRLMLSPRICSRQLLHTSPLIVSRIFIMRLVPKSFEDCTPRGRFAIHSWPSLESKQRNLLCTEKESWKNVREDPTGGS